eukprot:s941_g5.t1
MGKGNNDCHNYHRQSSWHNSDRDGKRSYWGGDNDNDSVSKWLTCVLRHGATEEYIYMDKHGYVSVDQLIALRAKELGKTTSLAKKQF